MKNVEDIYPLSPMQQGMLFHALYDPADGMYMEQKVFTLRGNLDVPALSRAWASVMERHPALRTAFIWQGLEEPLQVVRQKVQLPLHQQDWRGLSPDEQDQKLEAYLHEDRAQGMKPAKAPLMRLALFRLAEDRYKLVWTHHHLLLDGWSLPLIFKEIFVFYEAFHQAQELQLPRSRPYRDYIAWLQRQDLARAEAFWRQELQGFTAPTPIAIGRSMNGRNGEEVIYSKDEQRLSVAETEAIQAFAQQQQLTVNTLVQGAWGLLLGHYSRQPDVVFGATVSGRPPDLPGVESMVGLFINTLPVRVKISPETPLLPWLKELQARQVEMRQFEYSPLVQVHGWSDVPRDLPLFESILVFENYPVDDSLREQKVSIQIEDLWVREMGNYPLVVKATVSSRLLVETMYDERRIDAASNRRLIEHMVLLLRQMAAQPDIRLGGLEKMLIDVERREKEMKKKARKAVNLANFMSVTPTAVSLSPMELVETSYINDQRYPLVIQPAVEDVDLADWARSNLDFVEAELLKHGAILFRGFGLDSVPAFENFARAIRPDLFGDYGDLPPEEKGEKVYHSTPYPEDKTILFHNESSHWHQWPMRQFFCCLKASEEGGETPIVDCRKVYQRLDPKIIENFQTRKLMYVRNFVEGLDVSWQSFFRTDDKAVVEDYLRRNGIEFEWTENNGLRTRQIGLGVAKHPKTGEMVFFNQVQLHHTYFLDPELRASLESLFEPKDYPRNVYYGDGTPIEDSVMEEILNVYWDTSVSFRWQEGDAIMVDNMITAHARNPYKGKRKIVVALAEMISAKELVN